LLLGLVSAAIAAMVSQHLFSSFGLIPGAELLGAVLIGGAARLPGLKATRSLETRFLIETAAAAAGTAAAVSLTLPLGLVEQSQIGLARFPLLVLLGLGGAVGLVSMRWLAAWPPLGGQAPWPRAAAAAEAMQVMEGRFGLLPGLAGLTGLGLGAWAGAAVGLPAAAPFGLALLGNGFGLGALALGLLLRPALPGLLGLDLNAAGVAPGLMLGAALVALPQAVGPVLLGLWRRRERSAADAGEDRGRRVVYAGRLVTGRLVALLLYGAVAFVLLDRSLPGFGRSAPLTLLGWALVAAALAVALQLFAGLLTAQLGWLPLLGSGLVVLACALRLGLDPPGALLTTGLALAAGPLAAELGNQFALGGRLGMTRQPATTLLAALLGLEVALLVVGLSGEAYLRQGLVAPPAQALGAALGLARRGWQPDVLGLAMLVGGGLQLAGGPSRQVGLLLGTGLLVAQPVAGWALLAGLAARGVLSLGLRGRGSLPLAALGLGLIGAEAIGFLLS
jgi:hypothetical protein